MSAWRRELRSLEGWARAGVTIGWQAREVRLSVAGPRPLLSHPKMMRISEPEVGVGAVRVRNCGQGAAGGREHSQWGPRGPLDVPLWAPLCDSMKNELEPDPGSPLLPLYVGHPYPCFRP